MKIVDIFNRVLIQLEAGHLQNNVKEEMTMKFIYKGVKEQNKSPIYKSAK